MPKPCYSKCRKCTKEICREVLHKGTYSAIGGNILVDPSISLFIDLSREKYVAVPCMYRSTKIPMFMLKDECTVLTLVNLCDNVIAMKDISLEDTLKYVKIKSTYKEEQDAYNQRNKRRNAKSTSRSKQKI